MGGEPSPPAHSLTGVKWVEPPGRVSGRATGGRRGVWSPLAVFWGEEEEEEEEEAEVCVGVVVEKGLKKGRKGEVAEGPVSSAS